MEITHKQLDAFDQELREMFREHNGEDLRSLVYEDNLEAFRYLVRSLLKTKPAAFYKELRDLIDHLELKETEDE